MESFYQISSVPEKGKCVTALSNIPRGTLIVAESPLFTISASDLSGGTDTGVGSIARKLRELDRDQQRVFFDLHNSHKELPPILGIVKTNSIPLDSSNRNGGIFPIVSRFNHSCLPNALYSWHNSSGQERVYAIKDIQEGEEITVTYIPGTSSILPHLARRDYIFAKFNFQCACEACSNHDYDAILPSDRRRSRIASLIDAIDNESMMRRNPSLSLKHCRDALQLLAEIGDTGQMTYKLFFDAFRICVFHSDLARASTFAALAKEWNAVCQGKDFDGIKGIQQYIAKPQRHELTGRTQKWKTKLKAARSLDSEGFDEWLWKNAG